ncbi:TlpA family protein disulfide reductase [Sphingomonas psychrotolerans]|uniref:TlpA family protein disulfide reductase n=1 Tax=Sphingomonas psychrotolerans TaxID=1327635 RepID=A0ABU3N7L6_9SPHN|nr:TlpA disulfide reductase family protein [Sphingomonas psychrotolerans]MDT8759320.1 TlpA family protein disulfide reductase [Sphingomonas psychrotolerans]
MRPAIALLLLATSLTGGCDRQSEPQRQAEGTNVAAAAPAKSLDKLDRSHKGEAAPDFPFVDGTGKKHTLADFRGKPLLVNLWATWCAPCVKEMPTLDALATREGGELQVLAVSQDFEPAKVAAFFAEKKFRRLEPWIDSETAFSTGLGVNLPTTILYDAAGREVWRKLGDADWTGDAAAKLIAEAR